MDIFCPLSLRAKDFSIASLMSNPSSLDSMISANSVCGGKSVLVGGQGVASAGGVLTGGSVIAHCAATGVPAQRSTDCVFDWTQVPPYNTAINSMEGRQYLEITSKIY